MLDKLKQLNASVTRHNLQLPINLNPRNLLLWIILLVGAWYYGGDFFKKGYNRLFPDIDWAKPPVIDLSLDRSWNSCIYDYLEKCSPAAVKICDDKFSKPGK